MNKKFDLGDIEITSREIIVSIAIIAAFLIGGFLISGRIQDSIDDANMKYNTAVKIDCSDSNELFVYGMRTNIGNTFVYGKLVAVDPVSYPDIDGEYMKVKKTKEKYTMHTRQVAHTITVKGKTQTYYTTEVYYSWDYAGSESKKCAKVRFCDVYFSSDRIDLPPLEHIDTQTFGNIRYIYEGSKTEFLGTLFSDLREDTISEGSDFLANMTIDEAVEHYKQTGVVKQVLFWFIWTVICGACIYGFYSFENHWLE